MTTDAAPALQVFDSGMYGERTSDRTKHTQCKPPLSHKFLATRVLSAYLADLLVRRKLKCLYTGQVGRAFLTAASFQVFCPV
jgi:hypothetical protein